MAQDDRRSPDEPADMQQSRSEETDQPRQPAQSHQAGTHPRNSGEPSRLERYYQMVNWQESIIAGVVLWIVGFVLTVIPLWWFEFDDAFPGDSLHEIAVVVYVEGMGVTGGDDVLVTPFAYQAVLDSNAFGAGIFFHMILPAILLLIVGHILAGRHIKQGRTSRPLETILATTTLALWMTALSVLVVVIFSPDGSEVDVGELLIMTLLYTGVFSAIGGTIRSRSGITSKGGLLGGLGAFIIGVILWYFVEDPLDEASFSDLSGTFEHFSFLELFVIDHGLEGGELFPEWVVIFVPLLVGIALGYAYQRTDWVVGMGEGARLGAGYIIPVFLVIIGFMASWIRELERQPGRWSEAQVAEVSQFAGILPRHILLAGIVYPVVFAAIGGALGAVAYKMQQDSERRPTHAEQQQYGQEPDSQHQSVPDQSTPEDQSAAGGADVAAGAGAGAAAVSEGSTEQDEPAQSEELSASDIVGQTPDEPAGVDAVDEESTEQQPPSDESSEPAGSETGDDESAGDER